MVPCWRRPRLVLNREDQQRFEPCLVAAGIEPRFDDIGSRSDGTDARKIAAETDEVYRVAARRQNGIRTKARTCRTPGCGGPTSHLACHRELARILAMMRNLIGMKAFGGWFRCVNRMAFVTFSQQSGRIQRPASDLQTKQLPVLTTARQVTALPSNKRVWATRFDYAEWSHFGIHTRKAQSAFYRRQHRRRIRGACFAPNLPLHAGSLVEFPA